MTSLVGKIGSSEVPQQKLYFSTEFRWIVYHWVIARWHGKTCLPPQTMRIQNLSRREYLFSRLLRNAKGGAYAVKDFLAFHTRKPENSTDVYHFLKIVFCGYALVTYGNQLEIFFARIQLVLWNFTRPYFADQ